MVVVGFACSDAPKIYADGSVATDRGSHVGQVLSEEPDEARHRDPVVKLDGWCPPLKKDYSLRNLT